MAFDTPAVVLGAGINGLGVARSLARAGVPVYLLDADPGRAEMRTRAARPVAISSMAGDALVAELERLGRSQFAGQRPPLFLTQEDSVKAVSLQRARLSALYRFSLPEADTVTRLMHKQGFQQLAERHGAPIPALVHVRTPADLDALQRLRYPAVVKPGEHDARYRHSFKKAYRVESAAAARELAARILPVLPDVVVQEWIEGPDSGIYFCLQYIDGAGKVVASFTGRKVRSWPPQVGGTASCTAAPEAHAALDALTTRFFRDTGVIGMASMEYKRDTRSGDYRMVEPTIGRTDYQEEVATLNGSNLPFAGYCAELGLPVLAPAPPAHPRAWRVRSEDLQSAALQGQNAGSGFGDARKIVDACWRWSDPAPSVVQAVQRVRRAVGARARKLLPGMQAAEGKS